MGRKGRRLRRVAASALAKAVTLACLLPPSTASAQKVVRLSLPEALELASRNHPNLGIARAKLQQVRAQLDEARSAPFSQFKMTGGVALAPTLRGNNVFSPNTDVSLTSSLGVAWRATIDGVVPLWTFGKASSLWEAANANVAVNRASLEKERDAVHVDVRKAYFGLQLARESAELLGDARAEIERARRRLEEAIERDEGDPIDLLKLETYGSELEVREAEAARYVNVALAGLRFYTGVPNADVASSELRPPKHQLGHVTRYLEAARLYRPELEMARAGIAARTAQVHLARAQLFPDIGLGLSLGVSAAPEVANQINPFANDPGNYITYGAALVFQWKLDFLPQAARIRFAEGQLEEVRAQARLALGGAASEVEIAHAEAADWQKRAAAYKRAMGYAKRWLVRVQQGIDVGTIEEKELLEPARAYALQRYNYLNATMELALALSRLAKATGWDAIAPDGS